MPPLTVPLPQSNEKIKNQKSRKKNPGLNRMLDGFPTRAAWALCTFAYSAGPGTEPVLFEGRTDGTIVRARGPAKFGWDPVFEAEDTGLRYVPCLVLL
jgi:inosine triphosphate pyrophosphatase